VNCLWITCWLRLIGQTQHGTVAPSRRVRRCIVEFERQRRAATTLARIICTRRHVSLVSRSQHTPARGLCLREGCRQLAPATTRWILHQVSRAHPRHHSGTTEGGFNPHSLLTLPTSNVPPRLLSLHNLLTFQLNLFHLMIQCCQLPLQTVRLHRFLTRGQHINTTANLSRISSATSLKDSAKLFVLLSRNVTRYGRLVRCLTRPKTVIAQSQVTVPKATAAELCVTRGRRTVILQKFLQRKRSDVKFKDELKCTMPTAEKLDQLLSNNNQHIIFLWTEMYCLIHCNLRIWCQLKCSLTSVSPYPFYFKYLLLGSIFVLNHTYHNTSILQHK